MGYKNGTVKQRRHLNLNTRTCKCGEDIPTKWIIFSNRDSICTCTNCGDAYKWKKVKREIIDWLSLILTIFIVQLILKSENIIAIKIVISLILVAFMYLVTAILYIKFAIELHYDDNK